MVCLLNLLFEAIFIIVLSYFSKDLDSRENEEVLCIIDLYAAYLCEFCSFEWKKIVPLGFLKISKEILLLPILKFNPEN